jgi:hypothetical protein
LIVMLGALTGGLRPVALGELRVTEGTISLAPDGRLAIAAPKVRAQLADPNTSAAELRFRYLGPTEALALLDDGEAREQLGLKLRAQDACNVVYVMWRLQPKSELAVQVKYNPGLRTSRECGARGYRKLPVAVPLPQLAPGAEHTLAAQLHGEVIEVRVDNRVAWRGALDGGPLPPRGPAGLRTDNVRMAFELAVNGGVVGAAP